MKIGDAFEGSQSFGLKNSHLQNVLSSSALRKMLLKKRHKQYLNSTQELILETPKGVRLLADWNYHNEKSSSVVILIHGWEGSSASAYLLSMATTLYEKGHDTLRLQLRDHGESTHLNKEIFNSSMIEEVVDAIASFQEMQGYDNFNLVGFSLGGNFALRVGLLNSQLLQSLNQILAICPVLDPANTMRAIGKSYSYYDKYFVKKWSRSLNEKLKHFPEFFSYADALKKMKTLDEMNHYFIPRYTPFPNLEEYFDSYTLTGERLNSLEVPTQIVTSKDDPVIPYSDFLDLNLNINTKLTLCESGGHCAFLKNWKLDSWLDEYATQYFAHSLI